MKWLRVLWLVLMGVGGLSTAQALSTKQLVLDLEGKLAYLNGQPIALNPQARVSEGRALLPLREMARVLGVALEPLPSNGLRWGRLEVYTSTKLARLEGKQVGLGEVGAIFEEVLYVGARVLEGALGALVVFDPVQRLLTITYTPELSVRDTSRPVARFATDKLEYQIGEPVRILEFSYDPSGQPISLSFSGLEEAYFSAGPKTITLVVTNRAGRSSEPYTVQVRVKPQVLYSPRDHALRFGRLGSLLPDNQVLSYPVLSVDRQDQSVPLLVSDSPEEPKRSGILYTDMVGGPARVLAYHLNALPASARLLLLATNTDPQPVSLELERLGATAATKVVAVLGQVSLIEFLLASNRSTLSLEPGQTVALYTSATLAPGEGINLKADLKTSGRVSLTVAMIEESLLGNRLDSTSLNALMTLLPILEPDGVHVRGTFPTALRLLKVRMEGSVGRVVIGDGIYDPNLSGQDALTGEPVELEGNYGLTYRIVLEGSAHTVGAFSPRGGMYAGAIRVNGELRAVPSNGVLYRPDSPMIFLRESLSNQTELEFIPASGSFLPINLVFYRLGDSPTAAGR